MLFGTLLIMIFIRSLICVLEIKVTSMTVKMYYCCKTLKKLLENSSQIKKMKFNIKYTKMSYLYLTI